MSENKIIKTTVVADTSSYRKGMQDAAKETQDFAQKAQSAAAPAQDLGAALENTAKTSKDTAAAVGAVNSSLGAADAKWRQAASAVGSFQDMMRSAASGMTASVGGVSQAIGDLLPLVGNAVPAIGNLALIVGVGMATAYTQGSAEAAAYTRALALTGDAAGVTADEMADMAAAMDDAHLVTQRVAAASIATLVQSGKVTGDTLQLAATAATNLERVGVQSVEKTAGAFAELAKDPLQATIKLNEQSGYLTLTVYEQIKALEEQGRTSDAAAVAQRAYAEAGIDAAKRIEDSLGSLETAWKEVKHLAAEAWDSMLNIGRQDTLQEQLNAAREKLNSTASWWDRAKGLISGETYDPAGQVAALSARIAAEQKVSKEKADQRAMVEATVKWDKEGEQYLPKKLRMEQEIAKARNLAKEAGISDVELQKRIAGIEERYADKEKKTRTPKVQIDDERVLGDWQRRVAVLDAEAAGTEKLTATEQAYVSVLSDVTSGRVKMTTAARARFATLASEALALEQTQIQEKEAAKAAEEHAKWINALWQAEVKETARLEEGLKKEEERVAALGLTKEAVNQLAAAQLEEAAAAKEVEAANLKAASSFAGEFADAYKQAADAAMRQAEILRQTAGKKLEAANREAQIETQKGWEKISDSVGQAVTNALVQGGSSGIEMLKRAFKATVFQALVQPMVQQGTQAVMQLVGGGSSAGMGGGGLGSLNSLVSAGSSAAGLGGSLAAYQGAAGYLQFGSMASSFGTGLTAAAGGADLSAAIAAYEAAGMGATASGLGAGASAAGAMGAEAAGMMGSMMSGLAAAAPYLAVAMLVAQQLGAFKGPTYHHGGAYMASTDGALTKANNTNLTDFNLGWGAYTVDRSTGYDDAMLALSQGLAKQIDDSIKAYGGKSSGALTVGSRFASDNDDWSEGAIRIVNQAGEKVYDFTRRYTSDANKALQQFGEDSTRALLATLQQTDLSDEFDALFKGIDPLKASIGEINAVMQQATAIQQQISTVKNAVDSAFLAPAEQMQKAFDTLGVSAPKTVSEYQALVAAQDLNTAAGRELAVSLMSLYPQFQQLGNAVASQAASLQQQIWQLTGDTASIRAAELEKIDPANRALQERVWQLQDEQAASQAAAMAASSMAVSVGSAEESFSSLASALRGAVDAMTDETEAYQEISRKRAQSQIETALAMAKASGGSVLPKLEDISGALQVLQQGSASLFGSREDYLRDRYRTANAVASLGAYVPGFASGGDHAGGLRIVGEYGPEIESTGPSRIVSNSQARSLLSMDEVAAELRALRADMRAAQVEIARTSAKTARVLEKWDVNGMPEVAA